MYFLAIDMGREKFTRLKALLGDKYGKPKMDIPPASGDAAVARPDPDDMPVMRTVLAISVPSCYSSNGAFISRSTADIRL
jgi:hypothetical protein